MKKTTSSATWRAERVLCGQNKGDLPNPCVMNLSTLKTMPKAKRYRGRRQTLPSAAMRTRRKENGRPRGTFKRYRFEQTRLGFFLRNEVPVVYDVLMALTPPGLPPEPSYLLVRMVCDASTDPSLEKPKFARYLEDYKRQGLYCHRPVKSTSAKDAYYNRIREKKMRTYITNHAALIDGMRQNGFSGTPPDLSKLAPFRGWEKL